MIVATLRYARDDAPVPAILQQQSLIEQYGVEAVLGRRQLGLGEMLRMSTLRNLVRAVRAREEYARSNKNAIEFELDYPVYAALIERAEELETIEHVTHA